jgi:hypothetical protein
MSLRSSRFRGHRSLKFPRYVEIDGLALEPVFDIEFGRPAQAEIDFPFLVEVRLVFDERSDRDRASAEPVVSRIGAGAAGVNVQ